jgi:hypothetical protein
LGIRTRSHTIEVGESQDLEQAQGEDCEFRLSFTDSDGNARDLTGATAIVMTVRNRSDRSLIFSRSYTGFVGGVGTGAVRFQVLQADTADESVQPYDVDVYWTDASGYKEQLLVSSTFSILLGVYEDDDVVTTPPAIPAVYRLSPRYVSTTHSGTVGELVLATGGSFAVYMPQATGYTGYLFGVKHVGATNVMYTINVPSGNYADGVTLIALAHRDYVEGASDGGVNWWVK